MAYKVKQPILGFETVEEVILDRHDGITFCLKNSNDNDFMKLSLIAANATLEELNLSIGMKTLLGLSQNSKYSVYFPVIKHKNIDKSLINVGSPFLFNEDNGFVAQCILSDDQYTIEELFTDEKNT